MKPLLVLIIFFILALAGTRLITGYIDYGLAGRIAMSVMLVFTGIAHFTFTKGMVMMMPPFIPFKNELVYITGAIEIMAALTLQVPSLIILTSWMLIVFFMLLLPANIYAAIKNIDYQKGSYEGPGTAYLWFRVPLQVFFILWIYVTGILKLNT
jgi:uncharacterized membrane protein